ncbi:MAG TPA: hypothetical protein VG796_12200 [Verrucomicrobiales bacterium]|nr:hypothetical protein [Verrucomicrobiales bacterium]
MSEPSNDPNLNASPNDPSRAASPSVIEDGYLLTLTALWETQLKRLPRYAEDGTRTFGKASRGFTLQRMATKNRLAVPRSKINFVLRSGLIFVQWDDGQERAIPAMENVPAEMRRFMDAFVRKCKKPYRP